jgi:hypothetical protein
MGLQFEFLHALSPRRDLLFQMFDPLLIGHHHFFQLSLMLSLHFCQFFCLLGCSLDTIGMHLSLQ